MSSREVRLMSLASRVRARVPDFRGDDRAQGLLVSIAVELEQLAASSAPAPGAHRPEVVSYRTSGPVGEQTEAWRRLQLPYMPRNRGRR